MTERGKPQNQPPPASAATLAESEKIACFFDALEAKCSFLAELHEARPHEALLLCCIYLDGIANWLHPHVRATSENFVKTLLTFGGDETFALILPGVLMRKLRFKNAPLGMEGRVRAALGKLPTHNALTTSELLGSVDLVSADRDWLEPQLWRGTVAAIAHSEVRSRGVHWLGFTDGLTFSRSQRAGQPVAEIDFHLLHGALSRVIGKARIEAEGRGRLLDLPRSSG